MDSTGQHSGSGLCKKIVLAAGVCVVIALFHFLYIRGSQPVQYTEPEHVLKYSSKESNTLTLVPPATKRDNTLDFKGNATVRSEDVPVTTEASISYKLMPSDVSQNETLLEQLARTATPTQTWLDKRQAHLQNGGPRKVLLFCYMRGGSTFFSELFKKNPEAMYWYEPLDGFYSSTYGLFRWNFPMHTFYDETAVAHGNKPYLRTYPEWEKELAADFHHNMVTCNIGDLPIDLLFHTGSLARTTQLTQYKACRKANKIGSGGPCGHGAGRASAGLQECRGHVDEANRHHCAQKIAIAKSRVQDPSSLITNRYNVSQGLEFTDQQLNLYLKHANCQNNLRTRLKDKCINDLNTKCNKTKLVAYKALRISMEMVQNILEKDPDTHVIYFVRDPRAIAFSTKGAGLMSKWSRGKVPNEAKFLCKKMRHDLDVYSIYQNLYPGAIKLVRYEDLSREPDKISADLYKFIGVERHPTITQWIIGSQTKKKNGGVFSTDRNNWTASIEKWRKGVSKDAAKAMSNYCRDVLTILGYPVT